MPVNLSFTSHPLVQLQKPVTALLKVIQIIMENIQEKQNKFVNKYDPMCKFAKFIIFILYKSLFIL